MSLIVELFVQFFSSFVSQLLFEMKIFHFKIYLLKLDPPNTIEFQKLN